MSRRRLARLNEQLKRELAQLIRVDVRDPRVGPVTITAVEVAADLGSAKVFVRVVGGPEAMSESLEGLDAATPFLRGTLGRILKLRRIPELRFQEDQSLEHARRIEEILSDVRPIEDVEEPGREETSAGDDVPESELEREELEQDDGSPTPDDEDGGSERSP